MDSKMIWNLKINQEPIFSKRKMSVVKISIYKDNLSRLNSKSKNFTT
jgi:hypothetical protein